MRLIKGRRLLVYDRSPLAEQVSKADESPVRSILFLEIASAERIALRFYAFKGVMALLTLLLFIIRLWDFSVAMAAIACAVMAVVVKGDSKNVRYFFL